MTDYIKREDALELISKCISYTLPEAKVIDFRHGEMNGLNWAGDIIEAMPSADVVPVRHGHWIEYGENKDGTHNICCSVCDGFFKSKGHANSCYTRNKYRYCHNCGARMDGENDE